MKECYRIKDLFGAYLHDDVTAAERSAVDKHIAKCRECARDLWSRQRVLEKIDELMPSIQPGETPQKGQDDFERDVYRRIASDTMKKRNRKVFVRRFVFQPAVAVAALAAILTVGVTQFRGDDVIQRVETVEEAEKAQQKELRAKMLLEEFFEGTKAPFKQVSSRDADEESPAVEGSSSASGYLAQEALRRLEHANLINFSLGDRRRALAEYQQLVDYYPGTDVAKEAQEQIRTILGVQAENVDEVQVADTGI